MFTRLPSPASLSHTERMEYRASIVGSGYDTTAPETLEDGSAIFVKDEDSRFYLQVFIGKALRACPRLSGYYRTPTARADAIERFKQARARHHTTQLLRRQAAKQPHTLKVGDVLNTRWGYEQTNVEFYQVVAVSGVMVTLRQIAATKTDAGFMSGTKVPHPDNFIGEPIRRRANARNSVKIDGVCGASPWDGKPQHVSWYA